jgi:hypothetical protein
MMVLFLLIVLMGCIARPSLEDLEDDASTTGEWSSVERREELKKERLEASGPGCVGELNKYCVEEQSGIVCYCLVPLERDLFD